MADQWAAWVLERRFGGDPDQAEQAMRNLGPMRDRVLEGAAIREGDVVLDVGACDALSAFGERDARSVGSAPTPIAGAVRRVRAACSRLSEGRRGPLVDFAERAWVSFAGRAGSRKAGLSYGASLEHGGGAHYSGDLTWD